MPDLSDDTITGALLGTAVGDALGMPIEGLSHVNVRTYYKGIKEYRADDQRRDLGKGQWTDDTQMTFAVVKAVTQSPSDPSEWPGAVAEEYLALRDEARRWGPTTTEAVENLANGTSPSESGSDASPTVGAAMRAAPLGLWWASTGADQEEAWAAIRPVLSVTHRHPASLAAGWGQAVAVRAAALSGLDGFDVSDFWSEVTAEVEWVEREIAGGGDVDARVSERLNRLKGQHDAFPLDLRDESGGATGRADSAWPFACGMVARRPHLLENTLLSGINVGGDADTTGAMMGAMLGALHGWTAFPDAWEQGLEDAEGLELRALGFAKAIQ